MKTVDIIDAKASVFTSLYLDIEGYTEVILLRIDYHSLQDI